MSTDYFKEFTTHLLNDESPSIYFNQLLQKKTFPKEYPYTLLSKLTNIEQNLKYHPEGSVWNHTMQVIDHASVYSKLSDNKLVFMWTALLHDIGKGATTRVRKGKITSYNHEIEGATMSRSFLTLFTDDMDFINDVCHLVRWHMQPLFVRKNLPYTDIETMISETSISEIGLFSLCDRLGRGEPSRDILVEEFENAIQFLNICKNKIHNSEEQQNIIMMILSLSKVKTSFI